MITQGVWRFQCDPGGIPDPDVEVFISETTDVDGTTFTNLIYTPVTMKFSELIAFTTKEEFVAKAVSLHHSFLARAAQAAAELAALAPPHAPPPIIDVNLPGARHR